MPSPRTRHTAEGDTDPTFDALLQLWADQSRPAELEDNGDRLLAALVLTAERFRPAFHDRAACRGGDLEGWVPRPGRSPDAELLQLCGRCEVRLECRSWADEIGDGVAILGGEDGPARRARWRNEARRRRPLDAPDTTDPHPCPPAAPSSTTAPHSGRSGDRGAEGPAK